MSGYDLTLIWRSFDSTAVNIDSGQIKVELRKLKRKSCWRRTKVNGKIEKNVCFDFCIESSMAARKSDRDILRSATRLWSIHFYIVFTNILTWTLCLMTCDETIVLISCQWSVHIHPKLLIDYSLETMYCSVSKIATGLSMNHRMESLEDDFLWCYWFFFYLIDNKQCPAIKQNDTQFSCLPSFEILRLNHKEILKSATNEFPDEKYIGLKRSILMFIFL